MLDQIIKSIFGDPDKKKIAKYQKIVQNIRQKEQDFAHFTLEDVQAKTQEFKARFEGLDFQNEEDSKNIQWILEEILPEALANHVTACKLLHGKTFELPSGKKVEWNMIPYDVQLLWGIAIHERHIAEMKTWEWKTLVATIPAYLNALSGNSIHIVTVNDYLARRDAEEMGVLYNALGLSVWIITHNQPPHEKYEQYHKDVVYATNNEMGFDYLRDNMVVSKDQKSMSRLFFAIIA